MKIIQRSTGNNRIRCPFVADRLAALFVSATIAIALLLMAVPADAAVRITFRESSVTATGIRPGGNALWFVHSVTEFSGSPMSSRKVEVTNDGDRDGAVMLATKAKPSSVWVVVDITTGEYAVARPNG